MRFSSPKGEILSLNFFHPVKIPLKSMLYEQIIRLNFGSVASRNNKIFQTKMDVDG